MNNQLLSQMKVLKPRPKLVRNLTVANMRRRNETDGDEPGSYDFSKNRKKNFNLVEEIEYDRYVREVWNQFIERLYLGEVEQKKRKRKADLKRRINRNLMEYRQNDGFGESTGLASILSTTSLLAPKYQRKVPSVHQKSPNNLQEDIQDFGEKQLKKYKRFLRFAHSSAAKELFSGALRYITSLLRIEKLKLRIKVSKIDLSKKIKITTESGRILGPRRKARLEKMKLHLRKIIQIDRSKLKKEKAECLQLLKICSACYSYVLISERFSKVTEVAEERKFFDILHFFLIHMVTIRIESKELHPFVEIEIQRLFKLSFFPTIEQNKRARKFINLRDLHKKKLLESNNIYVNVQKYKPKERPTTSHGIMKRPSSKTNLSRRRRRPKSSMGIRKKKTSLKKYKKTSDFGSKRNYNRNRGDYLSKGRERIDVSYKLHKQKGGYSGIGVYRIKPETKKNVMFDRSPLISALYPRDEEKKFNVFNPFQESENKILNLEEEKKKDPFVFCIPTKTLLAIGREQEMKIKEKKKKRRNRHRIGYRRSNFSV